MKSEALWTKPAQRGPLLLTVVLACLLHLINISIPTLLLCLGMWGYHLGSMFRPLPRPGARLITVAGALFFLVAAATNEGLTVEAFVAILVLMIALKLFELRHQHDATMAVILNYFVIVSGMFFSDSLLVTAYIALCLIYNTAVLVHVRQPGMTVRTSLRCAGSLTLQALPFMLIFFIFFPRFQGGLWGRPPLIQAQNTSLSDTIRPGSIASLAENTEVAFRASFTTSMPPQESLYWRGLIFWDFDGLAWTRGQRQAHAPERTLRTSGRVDYSITLEPHQQHWLFTLDRPLQLEKIRGTWLGAEGAATTWRPVTSRLQYSASSDPDARLQQLPARNASKAGLQLPSAGNPRARQLALSWQETHQDAGAIVDEALAFFRQGGFRYTLRPGTAAAGGAAAEDATDYFLFTSKAGFCEHYATAFAFLMRAAGVPARLVGGYLGGNVNPYGKYLIVRQSEAHVWCEVLLDGEWRRIDPTAVVAPDRLRSSALITLGGDQGFTLENLLTFSNLPAWMQPLTNGWDLLNMRWNQWVMQYSFAEQNQLFAKLGLNFGRSASMLTLLIFSVALIGIVYFFLLVFLKTAPEERDALALEWRRFLGKLDKAGIVHMDSQGPLQLLTAICAQRPDLANAASAVVELYIRLRYASGSSGKEKGDVRQFREAVRHFSVQKAQTAKKEPF